NTEFAQLVAFPGVSAGRVTVNSPSSLWGLDTNLRCNYSYCPCNYRYDVLFGFRYLNLRESLSITEDLIGTAAAPAPFTDAHTIVSDRFATHNQFYGGQIGVAGEWLRGPWSLNVQGKVALGATNQQIKIDGSETIIAANGTTSHFTGGLLALSSNIGT